APTTTTGTRLVDRVHAHDATVARVARGGARPLRGSGAGVGADAQLAGETVDVGEHLLLGAVGGAVDQFVHTEVAVHLDRLRDGLAVEDDDVRLTLTTRLGPQFTQQPDASGDVPRDRGGHPPVGAPADPLEVLLVARRADQGQRSRLACGLGPGPARAEVHELAVVLGLVVGPQLAHGLQVLTEHGAAPLRWHVVVGQLVQVPAVAHAQDGAPV